MQFKPIQGYHHLSQFLFWFRHQRLQQISNKQLAMSGPRATFCSYSCQHRSNFVHYFGMLMDLQNQFIDASVRLAEALLSIFALMTYSMSDYIFNISAFTSTSGSVTVLEKSPAMWHIEDLNAAVKWKENNVATSQGGSVLKLSVKWQFCLI